MTLEFYKNKITDFIQKKYQGNINNFIQENPNLDIFLKQANLDNVAIHFNINEEIYQKILTSLNIKTKEVNNQNHPIKTQEQPKVKTKKRINEKKISGFVDAIIIAFITGSFIGLILLNIYCKIAQNI